MSTREGDRALWQPEDQNLRASARENERVRRMLEQDLRERVAALRSGESQEAAWGHARGDFARDWVALTQQLGLKVPGEDQRTPLRSGESAHERRVDAARTRLRQFLAGHPEQDWVLVGIESVICDRKGMALPPKAYQVQHRLQV